jgi:hypothetical protein
MPLLDWFWHGSDSWHVTVNSEEKHTVHGMCVHDIARHNVGEHNIDMYYVGVYGMHMPGVSVHKT